MPEERSIHIHPCENFKIETVPISGTIIIVVVGFLVSYKSAEMSFLGAGILLPI
jgi:hypothetical protein